MNALSNTAVNNDPDMELLSIYYQNIGGAVSKLNNINNKLSISDYDIVIITETWFNNNVLDSECSGNGRYNVIRANRSLTNNERNRGGGLCVLIKKEIESNELCKSNKQKVSEIVAIEISIKNKKNLIIVVVYIPPYNQASQFLHIIKTIEELFNKHKHSNFIIIGDFNLSKVQWIYDSTVLLPICNLDYNENYQMEFIDFCLGMGMDQLVFQGNIHGSYLDLCFSDLGYDSIFSIPPPISYLNPITKYHFPFEILIKRHQNNNNKNNEMNEENIPIQKAYYLEKINATKFIEEMKILEINIAAHINFDSLDENEINNRTELIMSLFNTSVVSAIRSSCPKRICYKKEQKNKNKDKKLLSLLKLKRNAYKQYNLSPTYENKEIYNQRQREHYDRYQELVHKRIDSIISDKTNKNIYDFIKAYKKEKSSYPNKMTLNG